MDIHNNPPASRRFSLPYTPGIMTVLDQLPVDQISDIYFSDNNFGSARALVLDDENYQELLAIRKWHGIKLHYLVNGNYYANDFYEKIGDVVQHVSKLDVDMLTLNNTYIMRDQVVMNAFRTATTRGVEIKNSVNNIVKTVKDVKFYVEQLGITHVIVDRALNRDLDELRAIRAYANKHDVKITMLVNEGCIVGCAWKNFDDMMIAQTNKQSNVQVIKFVHNELGCTRHFEQMPSEYLKTGFTLPTDLARFDGLVDVIKIAGRGVALEKWITMCKAYMYGDGNVSLKYLLSTRPAPQLMDVTSNMLDDQNFSRITENCKNVCGDECTLCDNVYAKLFK